MSIEKLIRQREDTAVLKANMEGLQLHPGWQALCAHQRDFTAQLTSLILDGPLSSLLELPKNEFGKGERFGRLAVLKTPDEVIAGCEIELKKLDALIELETDHAGNIEQPSTRTDGLAP